MQLDINSKVYEFKFGVKFIRTLDKALPLKQDGIEFGLALSAKIIPELQSGNINTLAKVLYMANQTEANKLTQNAIDDYVDECEDIEKLFDDTLESLKESNGGKLAMRNFEKAVKANKG